MTTELPAGSNEVDRDSHLGYMRARSTRRSIRCDTTAGSSLARRLGLVGRGCVRRHDDQHVLEAAYDRRELEERGLKRRSVILHASGFPGDKSLGGCSPVSTEPSNDRSWNANLGDLDDGFAVKL